jgi:DNA processing protein
MAVLSSEQEHLAILQLMKIEGIGPAKIKSLAEEISGLATIFELPAKDLKRFTELNATAIQAITEKKHLAWAEDILKAAEKHQIHLIALQSPDYPIPLRNIHLPPPLLYVKGNLNFNRMIAVAVVGTRKPTSYGKKVAQLITHYLVAKQVNVVSSLSYGTDVDVHRKVIEEKGYTTAVLANGLDSVYPATHTNIAQQIIENGALIAEIPPTVQNNKHSFIARNRIITGLCKAIVVIEAGEQSGTTSIALTGFEQNREVYAVPGPIDSPMSIGCNRLIRDNYAKLLTTPEEMFDDLGLDKAIQTAAALNLDAFSGTKRNILVRLQAGPMTLDTMVDQMGLPVQQINVHLFELDLQGIVRQLPGNTYELA